MTHSINRHFFGFSCDDVKVKESLTRVVVVNVRVGLGENVRVELDISESDRLAVAENHPSTFYSSEWEWSHHKAFVEQ